MKKAFYSDEEDELVEEDEVVEDEKPSELLAPTFVGSNPEVDSNLDIDHQLILKSSLPLLKSRNSGVVLGVCTLHYYCGTQNQQTLHKIGKALVRISRNQREVQYIVLHAINHMARDRPHMFRSFLTDFFVKATDPLFNRYYLFYLSLEKDLLFTLTFLFYFSFLFSLICRLLKVDILTSLCTKENIEQILRELQTYVKDPNPEFVSKAVTAVAQVVDIDPSRAEACMEGIMILLLCSKSDIVIAACVNVLRLLIQQNPTSKVSLKILKQLVKLVIIEPSEGGITESSARSSIVWLIGEYQETLIKVTPDLLRLLAKRFIEESTETKLQILTLAIKISLQFPEDIKIQHLMTYVLELSRYDLDVDLRDRARFMTALVGLAPTNDDEEEEGEPGSNSAIQYDEVALGQLHSYAKAIMTAPKLPPVTLFSAVNEEGEGGQGSERFVIASLSSIVGHATAGYETLPQWSVLPTDGSLRDPVKFLPPEDTAGRSMIDRNGVQRIIDSSDEEDEAPEKDDFKIFEEKGGDGGNDIASSSEEEEEESVYSNSSKDSSSSSSSEGEETGETKSKATGISSIMNAFKKTSTAASSDLRSDSMDSFSKGHPERKVKDKSSSSSTRNGRSQRQQHRGNNSSSEERSRGRSGGISSSSDDESGGEGGDLLTILGKYSDSKKKRHSSAPSSSSSSSIATTATAAMVQQKKTTGGKLGLRRAAPPALPTTTTAAVITNNLINTGPASSSCNPEQYMNDLEDAFGFLSTTSNQSSSHKQQTHDTANASANGGSGLSMTHDDFDALMMMPSKKTTDQPSQQKQKHKNKKKRGELDEAATAAITAESKDLLLDFGHSSMNLEQTMLVDPLNLIAKHSRLQ